MRDLMEKLKIQLEGLNKPYTVVLIDVDFFIRYCVRFNNHICDGIMSQLKEFLAKSFSKWGWITFSSGDEAAALLPGVSHEDGFRLADKIRREFRGQRFAMLPPEYSSLRITFSAGVVSFPVDGNTADIIAEKAVTALFMAKAQRRNQVFSFHLYLKNGQTEKKEFTGGENRVLYNPGLKIKLVTGAAGQIGSAGLPAPLKEGRLWEPQALSADEAGRLYIADQNNHQILCCDGDECRRTAGNGSYGYGGESALSAGLNKPTGLWCGGGRLLIADTGNDAVREVDLKTGSIRTIAGCGKAGFHGDGGAAQDAFLNKPGGVVCDRLGRIYINDIANNVIRVIDEKGIISRFAGSGKFGYSGDSGPAANAGFQEIYGIGIDTDGNKLFIADYGNHRIRAVDIHSGIVTTIAGCGKPGYSGDGGNPLEACLNRPVAVCADKDKNIFIADAGNSAVRMIPGGGDKIYTLAGGIGTGTGVPGAIDSFALANPNGLAVWGNTLYVLDGANNRVCGIDI